jgi:hypothetical protein
MNKLVGGTTAVVVFAVGAALALAVPGQANADAPWGAIAYSPSTNGANWGTGPTTKAAEDAAYNQCSTNANDCTAAAWTQTCAAVVTNNQGWGGGTGATREAAIQNANTAQDLGGAPAQTVLAQCLQS